MYVWVVNVYMYIAISKKKKNLKLYKKIFIKKVRYLIKSLYEWIPIYFMQSIYR